MIVLQQVKTGYGGRQVLQIDEFRFPDDQITVLIGRNGSGKSTLLRAMAGILPFRGEILIGGGNGNSGKTCVSGIAGSGEGSGRTGSSDSSEEADNNSSFVSVRELSHRERARRIGILPQSQVPVSMEAETLVMHGRYSRISWPGRPGKKDIEAVKRACEICGIGDFLERPVSSLSGGERQLCYLAMVIAQDPEIILLDEPMSAMDISHQIKIMGILRALKAEGRTIIMTSHDLPQSFTLADRIALLKDGRMIGEGTPEELVRRPNLVKQTMGAAVKKAEGQHLLYPYVLNATSSFQ